MSSQPKTMVYVGLGAATVGGAALLAAIAFGRPRIGKKSRLLVLGDSLAVGMSPHFQALSKELGNQFSSLARVGSRIDQWASDPKLDERLATYKPTLVLVSLGTNDEYGRTGAQQTPHIQALLEKLHAAGTKVYWIGPPKLAKSNGVIEAIQQHVPAGEYFDSRQLSIPRGPDNLHPTARGYAQWSGSVWKWLTNK